MTMKCADCSTQYAVGINACPHCGSSNTVDEEEVVTERLPLFLSLSCPECGRGPWTLRLESVTSGLVSLPTLACASCGSRVPVTWPPEEEPMSPKNHVGRAPTNARDTDVSPAVDASQPQDAAEGVLGRPTSEDVTDAPVTDENTSETVEAEEAPVEYEGMTLTELRAEADRRGVPSYGTKAQITERLREDDASPTPDASGE